MPLILKETHKNQAWGIWQIKEDADQLLGYIRNSDYFEKELLSLKTEARKKEWLSVRLLTQELGGNPQQIYYLPSGRPIMADGSHFFSCTHTKGYAAVIINKQYPVGIDIEQKSDRVLKLRSKFMSPEEIAATDPSQELLSSLLHWSAKETLFKVLQKENVDFRELLHILPFKVAKEGVIYAWESKTIQKHNFEINYIINEDFVMTRTILKK